jgi:hypothetical protein
VFASERIFGKRLSLAVPFKPTRVMNRHAPTGRRKGYGEKTNMTNAEANTDATVAEQGAHVAPETVSSEKGATQKKGGAQRPEGRQGR